MPVDFSRLVLRPAMTTFAIAVTVYPSRSQPAGVDSEYPDGRPYAARGVFATTPMDVQLEGDTIFSDQKTTLGIRLEEFEVPPMKDDRVVVKGATYWIADVDVDGQGGADLLLRRTAPDEQLEEV